MSPSRFSSNTIRADSSSNPWTHYPGQPIHIYSNEESTQLTKEELVLMPSYEKRLSLHRWADYHSVCYNALLNMEICPTRFLSCKLLHTLGICESVMDMVAKIGIGNLTRHCDIYPEMTRQFIASAEVHHNPLANPVVNQSYITYFYNGQRYVITFEQLCVILEFDHKPNFCFIDDIYLQRMAEIWPLLASHGHFPDSAFICAIKNPVIRVVANFLRRTLMPTDDLELMTPDLLFVIILGLDERVLNGLGIGFDLRKWCPINWGALFVPTCITIVFLTIRPQPL